VAWASNATPISQGGQSIMASSEAADGPLLVTVETADGLSIGRPRMYSVVSSGAGSRSGQRPGVGRSR
jgi:hypothetical protein